MCLQRCIKLLGKLSQSMLQQHMPMTNMLDGEYQSLQQLLGSICIKRHLCNGWQHGRDTAPEWLILPKSGMQGHINNLQGKNQLNCNIAL